MKGERKSCAGERVGPRSRDKPHPDRAPHHFTLQRTAAICGAFAFAVISCGCFMPAMALAPYAIQAVEAAGGGVASLASGGHKSPEEKGTPPPDTDICDELSLEIPMLVELRTDAT